MNRYHYLWLASALFIVYGTSLPFHFVPDPSFALAKLSHVPPGLFTPTDPHRGLSLPDMVQNVLLFVPFGLFGLFAIGRRPRPARAILLVTGLGLTLSLFVEALQLFTIDRSSSLNDVTMNTAGAMGGALLAPAGERTARRLVQMFRAAGLAATARSLYPLLVATALLAVAAWHPFDVALNLGGMWSDVKHLLADPLQMGALGDEGADALRYGLFAAAAAAWLHDVGIRRAWIAAGVAATLAAVALEGSQIFFLSRMPGGKDVIVGAAGGWLGAIAAAAGVRRWPARRVAALVVVLAWLAAALITLSPFEWSPAPRAFGWFPFLGYYRRATAATVSNVTEVAMAFFPIGFALAYAVPRAWLWGATAALALLLAAPLEYLQEWTVNRVPDVTTIGIAMLGAMLGAWMGGPVADRFARALDRREGGDRTSNPPNLPC